MSEDVVQAVIETIDNANQHRLRLAELLISLAEAKGQVVGSSARCRQQLESNFSNLKAAVTKALEKRLEELLSQVKEIERTALEPLSQCEEIIQKDVKLSNSLLQKGKTLLASDHEANSKAMENFKTEVNNLNLNSLPEVPMLSEVVCLHVDMPATGGDQLVALLQDYGRVISKAPVQITEINERPGALFIKWSELEEENAMDLSEFKLQYSCGNSRTDDDDSFTDVYQGPMTYYTLRHLKPNTTYTFRVCGLAEGTETWGPWSVPLSASTMLRSYEWAKGVSDYEVTNEGKVAERIMRGSGCLYSAWKAYTCGHSIVFKVLETGEYKNKDGIALCATTEKSDTLCRTNSLFVSSSGNVYLDGQEKTIKLPSMSKGSILTFETEVLQSGKVRVTIDIDEKIATFDWAIEVEPSASASPVTFDGDTTMTLDLYFGMKLSCSGWKIGVE